MAGCARNVAALRKAFPESELMIIDAVEGMIEDAIKKKRVTNSETRVFKV